MSTVLIRVDGVDRTNSCIPDECTFDLSSSAEPGTFSISLRDPNRVMSFITGKEVTLDIDGIRQFGGYIMMISMGHYFEADYIPNVSEYGKRKWVLQGTDYNIIFDKRIVRWVGHYTEGFIELLNLNWDGDLLKELIDNYTDMNDYSTSGIENIAEKPDGDRFEQGTRLRKHFEAYEIFSGAVWYASPNKVLVFVPYENVEKRWGFSDQPNNLPITASPATFQGSTIGYRSVDATEDGSTIINDALIWGGSYIEDGGAIAFSRVQDEDSIETHNRWQLAETHFGEKKFMIESQTLARARVIVEGPPGTDAYGIQKGLRFPQWTFSFTWFSDDVPMLGSQRDHLIPGDIVPIEMNVFGFTKLLPLRMLRISFPKVFESPDINDHLVQFNGMFGLHMSDPFTLWKYLLGRGLTSGTKAAAITTVGNESTVATLGSHYTGEPYPPTDDVETVFKIGTPTNVIGYIPGTLEVYINGLIQIRDTNYEETDFEAGSFTMASAPLVEDTLWVTARTQPK